MFCAKTDSSVGTCLPLHLLTYVKHRMCTQTSKIIVSHAACSPRRTDTWLQTLSCQTVFTLILFCYPSNTKADQRTDQSSIQKTANLGDCIVRENTHKIREKINFLIVEIDIFLICQINITCPEKIIDGQCNNI